MKKKYINNLSQNDIIDDFFLVAEKKILQTKEGRNYLFLNIKDRTGSIDAKKWNIEDKKFDDISSGDIISIKGRVEKFNNNLQIIINEIEKLNFESKYLEYLIPKTDKNINELILKINNFYDTINDKYLKKLLKKTIFDDEFFEKFKLSPAASNFHHSYQGGLLEHTVSVTEISLTLGNVYKVQNIDVLITGALLHDIGKVFEYNPVTFKRTDEGRLLGHIAIGLNYIDEKIKTIKNFPQNYSLAIKHIILSHHGEFEWGSPVQPSFLEALIIHFADNIDSKINPIISKINSEDGWTYLKSLRRNVIDLEFLKDDNIETEKNEKKSIDKVTTIFNF